MARYIDADEFIKRVIQYPRQSTKSIGLALADTPTADVMEVVRCKDCEYYTAEDRWCRRLGLCGAFDADGYCSHGERKEASDV